MSFLQEWNLRSAYNFPKDGLKQIFIDPLDNYQEKNMPG
jgi:hypothetical protein